MSNTLFIEDLKYLAATIEQKQDIRPDDVEVAWANRSNKVYNRNDVFYLLASLNLLNSAIKNKAYKKQIHYGGIKNNVSRILHHLITCNHKSLVDDLWINPEEGPCAYIVVNSFQFTFHHIPVSPEIENFIKSDRNQIKPWEGVRLQLIASDLFGYAQQQRLIAINQNTNGSSSLLN